MTEAVEAWWHLPPHRDIDCEHDDDEILGIDFSGEGRWA
jgi:hypothetical protein